MEWYDFNVYGYFAAIIGRNFFPTGDVNTSVSLWANGAPFHP